jgi:hypothetical protein
MIGFPGNGFDGHFKFMASIALATMLAQIKFTEAFSGCVQGCRYYVDVLIQPY